MSDPLRLFVGLDVGPAWTDLLRTTADQLAETVGSSGRWVRPELYHVTVLFLDSQPTELLDALSEAMATAAASVAPFELRLREVVRFGRHEHGALVAAVDDPAGDLQCLRASLDTELHQRGIRFDARGLVPHVTLVRPRRRAAPLPAPPLDLRSAPPLLVSEVKLVRSDLRQDGPHYQAIVTAPIGRS